MVGRTILKCFRKEQRGTSMVEGLIVFPLVLFAFSAFAEFAYATFIWNHAVKTLQVGARLAAVSDPVTLDYTTALEAGYPSDQGGPVPGDAAVSICDGKSSANCDPAPFARIVTRMQEYMGAIPLSSENIIITYHRSGLGFVGRPDGPVSTITIELQDFPPDGIALPIMNALFGFSPQLPPNRVTITSEDLRSAPPA